MTCNTQETKLSLKKTERGLLLEILQHYQHLLSQMLQKWVLENNMATCANGHVKFCRKLLEKTTCNHMTVLNQNIFFTDDTTFNVFDNAFG